MTQVRGIGGKPDLARTVEDADAVDALFFGDGLHHLVGLFAAVVKHGVPGGAGDRLGELVGAQSHGIEELVLFGSEIDQPGNRRHNDDDHGDGENELSGEAPRHHRVWTPK
jgi:hypothetical protein